MKKSKKQAAVPQERAQTIRQEIIELLKEDNLSIRDLSQMVGQSEKEITAQLSQIGKSVRLEINEPECIMCGFVFERKGKIKKPGKCPKCHSTRITSPRFTIQG
jgi:predicted Zn-ribbon and HTH transcriptional regulator